jgi:hypothetical protein
MARLPASAKPSPNLAENAKSRDGRDQSAIGREGLHTNHFETGYRLYSKQRTRHSSLH